MCVGCVISANTSALGCVVIVVPNKPLLWKSLRPHFYCMCEKFTRTSVGSYPTFMKFNRTVPEDQPYTRVQLVGCLEVLSCMVTPPCSKQCVYSWAW